jgi:Ca2+-transporting ATPase
VPIWRRLLTTIREPLTLVLIAAATLTAISRDVADTIVIGLVIVVNTVIALRQELQADRETRALADLAPPHCQVVRDGRQRTVSSLDIVRGDLILFRQGDLVPADAALVTARDLSVDESALSGESMPVHKDDADGRPALLWAGTAVVAGRGTAVVTATGSASAVGRIAGQLNTPPTRTPLERRMGQLSLALAVGVTAISTIVVILGLTRGEPFGTMLLTGVSLAVAAVPESLPLVVTITLAVAARRMASRHVLVRSLSAVETLGSVTLLATDKTGTLTRAEMAVSDVWLAPGRDDEELWEAVSACNDATVTDAPAAERTGSAGTGPAHSGDPTEIALLRAAVRHGVEPSSIRAFWPRTAEVPFDRQRRSMTTTHRQAATTWTVRKGAPEGMLSPAALVDPMETLTEAAARGTAMAAEGARVLAVADTHQPDGGRLRLIGLVALRDPLRPDAAATVAACQAAGMRVVLVTGDHPATASVIARDAGIRGSDEEPINAGDKNGNSPAALDRSVVARAAPSDKLDLIRGWQRRGDVVAMTGDGVNDAPALRQADVGVAMGQRGTEVARQAADVILGDDNLGSITNGVEEGRRVYANIRRFLLYAVAGGLSEILVMLAGPLLGNPLPLLPAQLLWVNLVTHTFAGAALGTQPLEPGAMQAAPRNPTQAVLGAGLWWRIGISAALTALLGICAAAVFAREVGFVTSVQTTLMVGLGFAQLGVAWGVRSRSTAPGRSWLPLAGSLALAALVLISPTVLPLLGGILTTTSLTPWQWTACIATFPITAWLTGRLRPRRF